MIKITNVKDISGKVFDAEIESSLNLAIDGEGLTLLPALIDTHVHFREPGQRWKEDWISASQAAVHGGVTTVFDMPNNDPSCITRDRLLEKKQLIEKRLAIVDIPLRYYLYFGADKNTLSEIPKVKHDAIGIKVFMGCSTGSLLVDDDETLETVFRIAAENDMIVSVHAEDHDIINQNTALYKNIQDPAIHSKIRSRDAASSATAKAVSIAEKTGCKLCILHMSTKDEVEIVKEAKAKGLSVFSEVTPHHLFLNECAYESMGTFVQVNPPLRTPIDQEALWKGLREGIIDFIGTDHAPHTIDEKSQPYGVAPSGVPCIEIYLSLLLNAYHQKKITLERIVEVTRTRIEQIFSLPPNSDVVLVDLEQVKKVDNADLKTKCQWTPYHGQEIKGWPVCTILRDNIYYNQELSCRKL